MSTTTTNVVASTETVVLALLAGNYEGSPVNPDTVRSIMEQGNGTTEKRAYAVAWRDLGKGNDEGGASMLEVFGQAVKKGGFGNAYAEGMRNIGREGEIASTGTGGTRTPRARGFLALIKAEREAIMGQAHGIAAEASATRQDAEPTDAELQAGLTLYMEDRKEQARLILAEIKALTKDGTPWTDAARAERQEEATKVLTRLVGQADACKARAEELASGTGDEEIVGLVEAALAAETVFVPAVDEDGAA